MRHVPLNVTTFANKVRNAKIFYSAGCTSEA